MFQTFTETRYEVWNNGKPAVYCNKPELGWIKYQYDTWEEAEAYAKNWLGVWKDIVGMLSPNVRTFYTNDDYIEIIKKQRSYTAQIV